MGDDAEQDGPADRDHYRVVTGSFSSKTRIGKTIVASPRGLTHPFRAAQQLLLVTLVE